MTNNKPAAIMHVYALRECLRAALHDRCPDLVEALDLLEAFAGTEAEADARRVAVRALALDDARGDDEVDLALWREYAATDINVDDSRDPADCGDDCTDFDGFPQPAWMLT